MTATITDADSRTYAERMTGRRCYGMLKGKGLTTIAVSPNSMRDGLSSVANSISQALGSVGVRDAKRGGIVWTDGNRTVLLSMSNPILSNYGTLYLTIYDAYKI